MLDLGDERKLSDQLWQSLPSRVALPPTVLNLQHKYVGKGIMASDRRQYARKPLQHKAILTLAGVQHACYTKDISRTGIGFYSPVNVLPRKVLQLWLHPGKILQLRVIRCRRLADRCYEVGTVHHSGE